MEKNSLILAAKNNVLEKIPSYKVEDS